MIFAAGIGSRLKSLTQHQPKALVHIGGISLLERCINKLIETGVSDIIINIHHFGEQIIDFVMKKNQFGINIAFSDERNQLLDTGGGLKKASIFFDNQPFIVHNVDIISEINLKTMYDYHIQTQSLATLAVRSRKSSRYLLFNEEGQLCGKENQKTGEKQIVNFNNNNPLNALAFSGIHIISPKIFSLMPSKDIFSITDFYINIAKNEKITAFLHNDGYWMDMGKAEDIFTLEKILLQY